MSNHALASTNIDQEKELSCLILWLDATAQVIGDFLSGFGPARAWIDKHRDELERGKLTTEWHDRVAEFDNGRKEIIAKADKALDYAGRVVGIVPTDHPNEAIDLLVEIKLRAESFSYLGFLRWESLDDHKFTFENDMPDAEKRLEHVIAALRVLSVIPKDATRPAEWSAPMSKTEIARRITGDQRARPRNLNDLWSRLDLDPIGNKYRVRLDTVDPNTRRKLEQQFSTIVNQSRP